MRMIAWRPRAKHAHHHPQLQRCPLGGGEGPVRMAARAGSGRRLPPGDEGPGAPARRRVFPAGRLPLPVLRREASRLQRRRGVLEKEARQGDRRLRRARIRRRRTLPRVPVRKAIGRLALPALGVRRAGAAGVEIPLPQVLPALSQEARPARPRLRPLRRRQHRPQGDRPPELEVEPEELRLPARGARLARPRVRGAQVGGRLPRDRPAARPVHLVVEPRPGAREERRLAHRLPDREPAARGQRADRLDLPRPMVLRPRAAHDGLRALSADKAQRSWKEAVLVYRQRPVLSMLFLGFSAGLPFYLVFQTLSAWLRQDGIERATIGMLAWVGLVYTLKFVWSPVVDRLRIPLLYGWLGKRRSWMLLAQVGIGAGLLNLAGSSPAADIAHVAVGALFLAFCSATQDISVDAWRIESASLDQQGAMVAAYQLGDRAALITGSAGALGLAQGYGWATSYTVMAALAGIGILTTLLVREPATSVRRTAADGEARVADWLAARPNWPEPIRRLGASFIGAVVCPFTDYFARYGLHT